jgi:hypothetical protein
MAEVQQARIFISYARKDMGEVRKLYELLKSYGFSPWMDIFDLKTGQDWPEMMIEIIHEVPIFLACLSNHSITKTGIVRREINEALEVAKERILSGDDVYIFPIRLEEIESKKIPMKLRRYNWVDWYSDDGKSKLIKDLKDALKKLGFDNPLKLRSQSLDNLTGAEVEAMILERNFYSNNFRYRTGIHHEYEAKTINGDKVVIDHATSLMWQQAGSDDFISNEKAQEYIKLLNQDKFAGFYDWRLPTLEEAMSLMEATQNIDLHIDSVFDKEQSWIWTADQSSASGAWSVSFELAHCYQDDINLNRNYVRAVRSG